MVEKEKLAKEAEEAEARKQAELEERKKESHHMVAEFVKAEVLGEDKGKPLSILVEPCFDYMKCDRGRNVRPLGRR